MSVKEAAKSCVGISHDKLDAEVDRLEKTARAELVRLGVNEEIASGNDPLIEEAAVNFICWHMASDEKERSLWQRAWEITSVALKDSSSYAKRSE